MYTRCIHADCAMCQIKTVKNEEYKVSLNFFFSLDQSSFPPFYDFLLFPFKWVKKEIFLQQVQVSPQDFLSTSLFLCLPSSLSSLSLFSHWNLWEKQANSLGPICVHFSRFYCNSCKVVLQQREIVKRLPWCTHIASYYMLFSGRKLELLILLVKLTIFIKYFGVVQIVSHVTAKVQ